MRCPANYHSGPGLFWVPLPAPSYGKENDQEMLLQGKLRLFLTPLIALAAQQRQSGSYERCRFDTEGYCDRTSNALFYSQSFPL